MRNNDKFGENSVANSVTIDLNVLGVHMKGGVIGNEDGSLIVTIDWHTHSISEEA